MHLQLKSDFTVRREPHDNKMHLKLKSDLIVKKEPHDKMPISDFISMLGTSCLKGCLYVQ